MSSSSSYVPETPPRSHRKHKRNPSLPYATPKTPYSRHHDITLDYKISSKTNLLNASATPFTVYQTPMTPKSTTKKNRDEIIITPPSTEKHIESPFHSRLLFPANPSRIGSGRSHTSKVQIPSQQSLKAPSLTTLLARAALESSSSDRDVSDDEDLDTAPKTPGKQLLPSQLLTPPKLNKRESEFSAKSTGNPFTGDSLKKELVFVDKYGRKKIEKLDDDEARLLQKTKRKLTFE